MLHAVFREAAGRRGSNWGFCGDGMGEDRGRRRDGTHTQENHGEDRCQSQLDVPLSRPSDSHGPETPSPQARTPRTPCHGVVLNSGPVGRPHRSTPIVSRKRTFAGLGISEKSKSVA